MVLLICRQRLTRCRGLKPKGIADKNTQREGYPGLNIAFYMIEVHTDTCCQVSCT